MKTVPIQRYPIHEEMNVIRLGLISIMKTVPEQHNNGWSSELIIGTVPGKITCRPTTNRQPEDRFGIPHGIDNDVSAAIHTLYIMQGCPADGVIRFTTSQILELMGMTLSGPYYQRVLNSIKRLFTTSYEIEAHWFTPNKRGSGKGYYGSTGFTYLSNYEKLTVEDLDEPQSGRSETYYVVTINEKIRQNLRDQHLVTFYPEILAHMGRNGPTVRATYRLLETIRSDPRNLHLRQNFLSMTTDDLETLGRIFMPDKRPSRILRYYEPALKILQNVGYLPHVEIIHRRKDILLNLEFTTAMRGYNPESLRLLLEAGVWTKKAKVLAAQHSLEQIQEIIAHVGQKQHVKEPGALITSMLENGSATATHARTSIPNLPSTPAPPAAPLAEVTEERQLPNRKTARFRVASIKTQLSTDTYKRLYQLTSNQDLDYLALQDLLNDPSDDAALQFMAAYA